MVTQNNYVLGVFNGDVGIVVGIEKNELTVNFGDGAVVIFTVEDLDILTLAYCSTVHKFQGSECPVIIMPLVKQHYMMLVRNLIYTGITRAKRRLVLVADEWSVKRAVNNNLVEHRYSLLCKRIRGDG